MTMSSAVLSPLHAVMTMLTGTFLSRSKRFRNLTSLCIQRVPEQEAHLHEYKRANKLMRWNNTLKIIRCVGFSHRTEF
jgi:hypothetical protein